MKHPKWTPSVETLSRLLMILFLPITCSFYNSASGQSALEKKFLSPPEEAKPRGYWIWHHGNFDYTTIDEELEAFKEKGLGGVDIFDIGVTDRLDIIPAGPAFLGEEQLDGIEYALRKASELDLAMGLIVSSSWNAGGSWTTPEDQIKNLVVRRDTISGPALIADFPFPTVPTEFIKPYGVHKLYPELDADGKPGYYRNVSLMAFPLETQGVVGDTSDILYFDKNIPDQPDNKIEIPEGDWVIYRAIETNYGQKLFVPSDNSHGYTIDHFSKEATQHHFNFVIDRLKSRMGDLKMTALERLYLASYEATATIMWTASIQDEFSERNGYGMEPFIPALQGFTVIDKETTERFLYDYEKTISDLFVENHYREARRICHENGLLICSESGGPGPPLHNVPTEDLMALGAVDIMRGEFWNKHKGWYKDGLNILQVVKNIASAAHIYGHKVVEMESFTSQGYHWQEGPFELKQLADKAYCEGMTRVVYHTMPHSPPEAGTPGWSYQAGTHVHPKMTWWSLSDRFHQYLTRCSAMLMEGRFVADVAYYYGHDIPNFASPKHVRPDLGPGYDYDDLNTEVLLQIKEVKNGRIILPSGMEYEVLVLPDDPRMDLSVIHKIEDLLQKGATIIGPKPSKVYGLAAYKTRETELQEIAHRIWGPSDRKKKLKRKVGLGTIVAGKSTREVLQEKGITPDFQYAPHGQSVNLDYIHRTNGREEIYFIRNVDSIFINTAVQFRVKGLQAQRWDPASGSRRKLAMFDEREEGTIIPLSLAPKASVFVIFSPDGDTRDRHITKASINGDVVFSAADDFRGGFSALYNEDNQVELLPQAGGHYEFILNDGEILNLDVLSEQPVVAMDTDWDVRFPYGWGVEPVQHFDSLFDWTKSSAYDLKHFSGTATYRKSFKLKSADLEDDFAFYLDLGQMAEVARIYLNGKAVGVSIFPPHRMNVTDLLKQGDNHLVVEVVNTWLNRMIGDLDTPLDKQYTRSSVSTGNEPSQRPWSSYELIPSGLMGPVQLVRMEKVVLKNEQ